MEIRSYRRVFDLERRIYRVDRLRLNPGGVPLRGIVYFLAIFAATVIAGRLPLLAGAVRLLPWYLRDLAMPVASAAVLTIIRVEGRPFHLAAYAVGRYRSAHRWSAGVRPCPAVGARWHPQEIVFLPDGSDGRMRRLRYTGPGAALVAVEHQRSDGTGGRWPRRLSLRHRPALTLWEPSSGPARKGGQVIALAKGAHLRVRATARPKRAPR
jgi:hypothetical protein